MTSRHNKVYEARICLGFDKGYLEKLEMRKKLRPRGELVTLEKSSVRGEICNDLVTADNVWSTLDSFSLTLDRCFITVYRNRPVHNKMFLQWCGEV